MARAGTVDGGHKSIETRGLSVCHECVAHLGWPGTRQVCRVECIREVGACTNREIAHAVTSASPEQAMPKRPLGPWRDHWLLEKRLWWRHDVGPREDQSRVRSDSAPQAMAALRDTIPLMLRDHPGSRGSTAPPTPMTAP